MHAGITQQTAKTPTLPKRFPLPQLDTIRVLAMLSIFLHHLWKTVFTNPEGIYQQILDPVFSTASDGVILFNIISGFLLAKPHLGPEQRPSMGYGDFLRKRFLRIIPAYYLALLVFTLVNIPTRSASFITRFSTMPASCPRQWSIQSGTSGFSRYGCCRYAISRPESSTLLLPSW
jgi:peptidoglycan/LPS O-acetylase OafA/YrhL